MDRQHSVNLEITTYENEAVRMAYLQKLFRKIHSENKEQPYSSSRPELFRTPGTFLLEYAVGLLELDDILQMVNDHPEVMSSTECMDERVIHAHPTDKIVLSSHDSCGAAGVVAGLLTSEEQTKNEAVSRLEKVLGGQVVHKLIEDLKHGASSDILGKVWSEALVALANKSAGTDRFVHEHLPVDHNHHYASLSVIDAAGEFMAPTPGNPGERPFIVSNPEFLGYQNKEQAFKIMAEWAVLSLAIAWGGHSEIQSRVELPYQVVVAVSPATKEADQALFMKHYQTAYQQKASAFGQHKAEVHFVTAQDLA